MITRIRIQNYRSLIDVDVPLEPLTVLIGRSGTGKSNFVGAIRALRDVLLDGNPVAWHANRPVLAPQSTTAYQIHLKIPNSTTAYLYEISFAESSFNSRTPAIERLLCDDRTIFAKENNKWLVKPAVIPDVPISGITLGLLNGIREAAVVHQLLSRGLGCYDFPGTVLQLPSAVPTVGYADDGQNYLATSSAILDDISRFNDWTSLTRILSSLNPSIQSVDVALPRRDSIKLGYRAGSNIVLMDGRSESEGVRRYFATLLALYQAPSKSTAIFEHPEHAIHPGALETLANEFKRHVKRGRGQVILTTHNPQFLDNFEPEQIRVVTIADQQTKIGPLASGQLEAIRENLLRPGELLTVDPARLEGQLDGVAA